MRINLFGGPCSGKSTLASFVFASLKMRGLNIELISEYIKTWAYEKRELRGCDQFYVFAKQWRKEDIILRNGVDHLISDSPLLLQCIYAQKYGAEGAEQIRDVAIQIENRTPSLNIVLERRPGDYKSEGRWQDEKAAFAMDDYIRSFLNDNEVLYSSLPNDASYVLEYVVEYMKATGIKV
jgi:nicotinamide riboside kinase